MIRALRALLIFLSFSLEIQVSADWATLLNQTSLTQYPSDCTEQCGYKTFPSRKYTVELTDKRLTLGSDTIVLRRSAETFAFVSGEALLNGNFSIELPVGTLVMEGEKSLAYLSKLEDKYLVRTLFGTVKIFPKGAGKSITIPQGYENTISGVTSKGFAETGFPVSVDLNEMIYKWASLYDGEKKQFARDIESFKEVHAIAREEISQTYTEISGRMIASHEAWLAKEKIRKERERRERAALQKLYERKIMGLE